MPKRGYKQTDEHRAKIASAQHPDGPSLFVCPFCGASKEMPPARIKMNRTCGAADCRDRYKAEVGHANKGRHHTEDTKAKIGQASRQLGQTPEHIAARTDARLKAGWFADPEAVGAKISASMTGIPRPKRRAAGNPMWRGGVSVLRDGNRQSSEYTTWRLAVLDRDGWVCQACGSDRNVIAHHILSWHFYKRYRTDPNNGIALCRSCHAIAHGYARHFYSKQSRHPH